jgi:hypothetical protein
MSDLTPTLGPEMLREEIDKAAHAQRQMARVRIQQDERTRGAAVLR